MATRKEWKDWKDGLTDGRMDGGRGRRRRDNRTPWEVEGSLLEADSRSVATFRTAATNKHGVGVHVATTRPTST